MVFSASSRITAGLLSNRSKPICTTRHKTTSPAGTLSAQRTARPWRAWRSVTSASKTFTSQSAGTRGILLLGRGFLSAANLLDA